MGYLHDLYRGAKVPERKSAYVIGDKAAYVSPMSRTVVEGRAAHREHMKQHNVVEAGDMKLGHSAARDNSPMGRAGADIAQAIREAS